MDHQRDAVRASCDGGLIMLTEITGFIIAACVFFIVVITRTAIGAGAAWLIAMASGDAVYQTLTAFSLLQHPVEAWQLGATLGFLGGMIRGVIVR
jgi:hypothetical protein